MPRQWSANRFQGPNYRGNYQNVGTHVPPGMFCGPPMPQNGYADFSRPPPNIPFMGQPPLPDNPPPPPPPPPPGDNAVMPFTNPVGPRFRAMPRGGHSHTMRHRNPANFNQFPRPRMPYKGEKRKRSWNVDDEDATIIPRKKSMSKSYPSKPWDKADAEKALSAEMLYAKREDRTILIRFPEPDITADMVTSINSSLENVHFQVPGSARYCFVTVKENSKMEEVMEQINKTDFFGRGKLTCEKKITKSVPPSPEDVIDPYTLYLGNLPLNIPASTLKDIFTEAQRIDIGYAQRMKCTRYAFVRYNTVEDAIDAYHLALTVRFDSRTLIVRFRRQKCKTQKNMSKDEVLNERRQMELESTAVYRRAGSGCSSTDKSGLPAITDIPANEKTDRLRQILCESFDNEQPMIKQEIDDDDSDGFMSDNDTAFTFKQPLLALPSRPHMTFSDNSDSDDENPGQFLTARQIKQEPIDPDEVGNNPENKENGGAIEALLDSADKPDGILAIEGFPKATDAPETNQEKINDSAPSANSDEKKEDTVPSENPDDYALVPVKTEPEDLSDLLSL